MGLGHRLGFVEVGQRPGDATDAVEAAAGQAHPVHRALEEVAGGGIHGQGVELGAGQVPVERAPLGLPLAGGRHSGGDRRRRLAWRCLELLGAQPPDCDPQV